MKINDAASAGASDVREPYIGMPVYVDQKDHERYYGKRARSSAEEIRSDLREGKPDASLQEMRTIIIDETRGDTIGEMIPENIEAYCRDSMFESWPIAMAYVPWQSFREIYGPEDAFAAGTIFAGLDLPFLGGGGR